MTKPIYSQQKLFQFSAARPNKTDSDVGEDAHLTAILAS